MKWNFRKIRNNRIIILRKNPFKHLIAFLLIMASFTVNAQDQKTLFEQWSKVETISYGVSGSKGNYTFGGVGNGEQIKLLNMDDPYIWGLKLVAEQKQLSRIYHVDKMALPVLLRASMLRDNEVKYYMQSEEGSPRYRLLIVGDYMYKLKGWKSKDDYKIISIYTKGAHRSTLKLVRESYRAEKKMGPLVNHEEKLQAYLDKEYASQTQNRPAWNKKHAKYLSDLKAEIAKWDKDRKAERVVFNKKLSKIYAENEKRSGGGKPSSKSSSGKTVKVHISNKGSHGNIMIYWKEGGNWRHSGYSKGYSGIITVPEGAQLYYVENNSAKKPFFVAPKSGSGTYSF